AAPARRRAAETRPVEPIREPPARFGAALAASRLLTPVGASAKHFLAAMRAIDADHELTLDALNRFSAELLTRANAAIIELDSAAAETWLDERSEERRVGRESSSR